ncbi:MAG: hypothetical protein R3B54_05495 [Bdellovibrionota bacterium]
MIRHCFHLALFFLWLSATRPLYAEPVYQDEGARQDQIESEEDPPLLPIRRARDGEENEKRSAPRRRRPPEKGPTRPNDKRRRQERVYRPRIRYERPPASPLDTHFLSALVHTPLIRENTYDRRFTSYGLDFLASLPIVPFGDAFCTASSALALLSPA